MGKKKKRPEVEAPTIPDLSPERRRGGLLDCNHVNHCGHLPRNPLKDREEGRVNHQRKLLDWYTAHGEPATVLLDGQEVPFPPVLLKIMFPNLAKGPRR